MAEKHFAEEAKDLFRKYKLEIPATIALTFLAACGGTKGSGAVVNASSTPTPEPSREASMPFPRPEDFANLSETSAALALFNAHREAAGSPPVVLDIEASRGAESHAQYMIRNPQAARLHFEDPGLPGYTPEGDEAARQSSLSQTIDGPRDTAADCVERILIVPYHRTNFLQPGVRSVRLGFAREGNISACVLGALPWGPTTRESRATVVLPVVYPAPGETNVPTRFAAGEFPDPLDLCRDANGNKYQYPAGFPITVEFRSWEKGIQLEESTFLDSLGQNVEHCLINAELPHPDQIKVAVPGSEPAGPPATIIALSKEPLRPNTGYRFTVRGTYAGLPFEVTTDFTTGTE
ncbi:MAG: CAP domain-containing protein [Candidatus Curtissbacteria bacterium]